MKQFVAILLLASTQALKINVLDWENVENADLLSGGMGSVVASKIAEEGELSQQEIDDVRLPKDLREAEPDRVAEFMKAYNKDGGKK